MNLYLIEIKEKYKTYPKTEYYLRETMGLLHSTEQITQAMVFESEGGAHEMAEFIEFRYDYKAKVLKFSLSK